LCVGAERGDAPLFQVRRRLLNGRRHDKLTGDFGDLTLGLDRKLCSKGVTVRRGLGGGKPCQTTRSDLQSRCTHSAYHRAVWARKHTTPQDPLVLKDIPYPYVSFPTVSLPVRGKQHSTCFYTGNLLLDPLVARKSVAWLPFWQRSAWLTRPPDQHEPPDFSPRWAG
jgi:hypothetical protein